MRNEERVPEQDSFLVPAYWTKVVTGLLDIPDMVMTTCGAPLRE